MLDQNDIKAVNQWLEELQHVHEEYYGNSCRGCWTNSVKQGKGVCGIQECTFDCEYQALLKHLRKVICP